MRTCSALPNWSVPETTMRSPSSRPDTISTLLKLLAPAWIGRRVALPPSTTHAKLPPRSEEHTSELQSLMRISYAVFCLKKKKTNSNHSHYTTEIHTQ